MTNLPLTLALISTIPFAGLSFAVSMQMFADNLWVIHALLSYSAVLLSFLGGIHWGIAITSSAHDRVMASRLIAASVLPSALAWGALFYTPIHVQLLALTVLFTLVWGIDSMLIGRKIIPAWFFEIRCIITPMIVVSLYVAYFGMI